ncbi:MAG: hypothetical protein M3134_11185 [Actinomycetota bacterium]|nr:hypothetical protein [Actinomycetota bacterium]
MIATLSNALTLTLHPNRPALAWLGLTETDAVSSQKFVRRSSPEADAESVQLRLCAPVEAGIAHDTDAPSTFAKTIPTAAEAVCALAEGAATAAPVSNATPAITPANFLFIPVFLSPVLLRVRAVVRRWTPA